MKITEKIRIPWVLKGIRKPKFTFELPKIDLSESSNKTTVFLVTSFFVSLMAAGFIYMLVNNPPAIASDRQGNPVIVLSGLLNIDRETLLEGLTVVFLLLLSSIGSFILRTSSEMATDEEARSLWLYGGLILLSIGLFGLMVLFGVKVGG